jgi:Protein of unknown function (DUF3761)
MKAAIQWTAMAAALCFAALSFAQAPADAPAGTNGLCNDGTYSQAEHKRGACRGHKGVKEWYGASGDSSGSSAAGGSAASAPAASTSAPAASTPAPSAPAAASAPSKKSSSGGSMTPPANPAPGGGPGMVWVNTSTNVYHCPGDRWYGKTKHGEYMSESDAKAKNARPDHGKPCQS